MLTYVMGHMNPDADSIFSAIAIADFLNQRGTLAKAVAQGNVAPESAFIIEKFGLPTPEVMTSVAGKKLWIVDTSDSMQLPEDLADAEILGVVDHHKIGNLETPNPIEMWAWPVGCTGTVIKAMYDYYGLRVPANVAGGLVCAILSDTVMFKAVTCTDRDKKAVAELAEIAGIKDVEALGMEMFKVKSAVEGATMRELVFRDFKNFDMSGNKVGIGQLEVIDLSMLDDVKSGLVKEIAKVKEEGGHHSVFLLLTDIMKEGSELLILSDDKTIVKKTFDVSDEDDPIWLPGIMSRKKQVVPDLERMFKGK